MAINYDYAKYWKDLGSVIIYNHPNFQFNSIVILVEFENCLINKISPTQLYHAISPKTVTPYREEFIKVLQKEITEIGVIIVSNVPNQGKLAVDSLKRKVEAFYDKYNIPALAFFSLKPNKFSKPHTGIWTLINSFYKKSGHMITKSCVVSDFGGRLIDREMRTGAIRTLADKTDLDRAFAHNTDMPYKTISEYLNPDLLEKFSWNNLSLSPEDRLIYIKKLREYRNLDILKELFRNNRADVYMILVYGAPRSGKTTVCKELVKQWRVENMVGTVKRLGRDKYTTGTLFKMAKKYLEDKINVIIDGNCHTENLRSPFIQLADMYKAKYITVEVNPGMNMAYIFNHVAVETATTEDVLLYENKEYYYYNSIVSRPDNVIIHCPEIQSNKQLTQYRY